MTAGLSVPRETQARLDAYLAQLRHWQARLNLVSASSLPDAWTRHVLDSAQLADHATGERWVDLGSGAGLPGLILAALDPLRRVTLVESDGRKCAFLRHAAHAMPVEVEIVADRIERAAVALPRQDIVCARALAPLDRLLAYAQPLLLDGAVGLFSKGRRYADELTAARESWTFDVDVLPSRTDPEGRILRIRNLGSKPGRTDRTPA